MSMIRTKRSPGGQRGALPAIAAPLAMTVIIGLVAFWRDSRSREVPLEQRTRRRLRPLDPGAMPDRSTGKGD